MKYLNFYKMKVDGSLVILLVFLAAVSTFLNYRGFGRENQIAEFPILYRVMDSNYLPNDFYTNRASEFGPRYLYAKFTAFIANEDSLPLIAFLLTLLINAAVVLITFFFARDIFRGSILAGLLAALLVMTVKTFALGYWPHIYVRQLLSGSLAVPFIFASFWAAIRRRPYLLAFCAGIALLIHPTFGAECGVLAFLLLYVRVILNKKTPLQPGILKLAGAVVIFLIFVALPLLPYLALDHIDTRQFMAIETFLRHPHHSVPSFFRGGDYAAAVIFLLAAGLAWFMSNRQEVTFPFITIVILFFCICGYIFVEIIPLRLMAFARPFRLLFIVKWLGLIMIAGAMARFLREKGNRALTLIHKIKPGFVYAVVIVVVGMMILLSIIYYTPLNNILPGKTVAAIKGIMPELRYADLRTLEVEAARFARGNTPEDAIFLTPPVFGKFRLVARRALVVDWRSFPFQDRAMVEWRQRIFDCYGVPGFVGHYAREELNGNYKKIRDSVILELRKKYGFAYAVLYQETPTKFPVIYENRKYKILHLRERYDEG